MNAGFICDGHKASQGYQRVCELVMDSQGVREGDVVEFLDQLIDVVLVRHKLQISRLPFTVRLRHNEEGSL